MSLRAPMMFRRLAAAPLSGGRIITRGGINSAAPRFFSVSRPVSKVMFSSDHEWFDTDTGRIGITKHAASSLGDIVYTELPTPDTVVEASTAVGSIESVKAVSELYMPISGKIVEVNQEVAQQPGLLNDDPQGEGWLMKVEPSNKDELEQLMEVDEYNAFVEQNQ